MTVGDFVEQWHGDSMQEHSTAPSHAARSKKLLYLKDWHFVKVRLRIHLLLMGFRVVQELVVSYYN